MFKLLNWILAFVVYVILKNNTVYQFGGSPWYVVCKEEWLEAKGPASDTFKRFGKHYIVGYAWDKTPKAFHKR